MADLNVITAPRPVRDPNRGGPDDAHYEDTGCQYSPSCLACPLAKCVHDYPRGVRQYEEETAAAAFVAERDRRGISGAALAREWGISRRTAYRYARRVDERRARR